jgi:hypothetical protein
MRLEIWAQSERRRMTREHRKQNKPSYATTTEDRNIPLRIEKEMKMTTYNIP